MLMIGVEETRRFVTTVERSEYIYQWVLDLPTNVALRADIYETDRVLIWPSTVECVAHLHQVAIVRRL